MSAATLRGIEIEPAIAEVAARLGVTRELSSVMVMTEELFPGDPMRVEIDDDPEITNDRHLAIVVTRRFTDPASSVAEQNRWIDGLFECCPAPLAHHFRFAVEFSE